ncbi:hypothetical protein MHBO_002449 [Bonamia ostreae]
MLNLIALLNNNKNLPAKYKPFLDNEYKEKLVKIVDSKLKDYFGHKKKPKIKRYYKFLRFSQIRLRKSMTFPAKLEYEDSDYEKKERKKDNKKTQ